MNSKLKKILVVDDDPNMHRLIELYLNSEQYKITSVSSGRMALHKLKEAEFDLIISDIQMPQMDGIRMTEEIRKKNKDIPIIVISAFGKNSHSTQAREAGANLVIEKPFEQETLVDKIGAYINGKTD